eukprot:COSAG01_NODE_563_length_15451_cov_70.726225_15_plen_751_part_00
MHSEGGRSWELATEVPCWVCGRRGGRAAPLHAILSSAEMGALGPSCSSAWAAATPIQMVILLPLLPLLLLSSGSTVVEALRASALNSSSARRVNWFVPAVGISPSADKLNNTAWAAAHRDAITGYFYCCACWTICPHDSDPVSHAACAGQPNGTFVNTGRCPGLSGYSAGGPPWPGGNGIPKGTTRPLGGVWPPLTEEIRANLQLGLTIVPTAAVTTSTLLSEMWSQPLSMESAVALVRREGWSGLGLDNEIKGPPGPSAKNWDPRLPSRYASLVGNLSGALARDGLELVSDVTSTWHGDLGGPEHIPAYARAAPQMRVMDMATYFNSRPNGFSMAQTIANLTKMMGGQVAQVGLGVGAMQQPGHEGASCTHCGNTSDLNCGCIDYQWNASALARFVADAEAAGVREIDVWRMDIDQPPRGQVSALSDWFIGTLAGFLSRGTAAKRGNKRRVNWFVYPVAIGHTRWNTSGRTLDGLNNTGWARAHRDALTGYSPCCGCWDILPNGTFVASGMCVGLEVQCRQYPMPGMQKAHRGVPCDPRMQAQRAAEVSAEVAMGLDIFPTGTMHHDTLDYLLTTGTDGVHDWWQQPGSLESAVELVRRNGWAGLQFDCEAMVDAIKNPRLASQYNAFVGNLSEALHAAGFKLVVDVTSTWHGNIAGPEYLAGTARAAPNARFMDMATYFNSKPNGMTLAQTLAKFTSMLGPNGSQRAAVGVGAEMLPGYANASCASPTNCINCKCKVPVVALLVPTWW